MQIKYGIYILYFSDVELFPSNYNPVFLKKKKITRPK